MALFNNQTTYIDENVSYGQFSNNTQMNPHPMQSAHQEVNVIYSTLQPTATEFHPLSSSNGAIRKEPQRHSYNRPKSTRPNSYGSGRTFSNSRGYRQKNERSEDTLFERQKFSENDQQNDQYKNSVGNSNSYYNQNDGNVRGYANTSSNSTKYLNNYNYQNEGSSNFYSKNNYSDDFSGNGRNFERYNRSNFSSKSENFPSNGAVRKGYNYNFAKKSSYNKSYKDKSRYNTPQSNGFNRNKMEQDSFQSEQYSSVDRNNVNFKSSYKSSSDGFTNNKFSRQNVKDFRNQSVKKTERNIVRMKKVDAASQKERLEEMIYNRILECLVCCEKIKNNDKIWSCQLCFHILHLHCVTAWAKSSKLETGWRCPACQNVCREIPDKYNCYCGKSSEPKSSPSLIAHGCGEVCLRKGRTCDHKCTLLCHPGPCPDCNIMVSKTCGCGATSPIVKCSTGNEIICDNVCNKLLECGTHRCKKTCHSGECDLCKEIVRQECYCGKVGRKVPCNAQYSGQSRYECGEVCGKQLTCGNHTCKKLCHEGPCEKCLRDVDEVMTCPCGKTLLEKPRSSCLESIPCCDKICGKQLKCGQPGFRHTCNNKCHENECPPCPLTTVVRCRCGHMDKELPCQKLTTNPDDTRCEKKCTKKRLCGKHKCNQRCCIEIEHICPLPCNHLLSCGQHRCERTCHSGRCSQCMETSFEELYCECGASVLYPPIPCGTRPPACNKPCSRPRNCEHDVNHNCHTGPCPPCTVLCKKWCYGHHEQRSAIVCHQDNFSCGLPCGKEMPCGKHKCNKPCHGGPCPTVCNQPCTIPRRLCGHICGKPCHDPPCPESGCKQKVPVTCTCGLQKAMKLCTEVDEEFKNIEMAQLREKIGVSSKDQAVDISDIVSNVAKPSVLKILECNDECRILERNRRLAIGLQIINPDLSQKLTPKYNDFMRQWAKKDANFCQRVHDKLTDLVQLAKQSKQKSRSYSFESMNKDKRHFIHEYCEHFGVDSAAYDSEPNRNVVATAIRDKSWLPSMSLLEVIQRENGQRKVPGPISVSSKSGFGKSETVSLKLPSRLQRPVSPPPHGDVNGYVDPAP